MGVIAHSNLIRTVSHVTTSAELYAAMVELELEGIVAKWPDSRYLAGRSAYWQKIKTPAGKERERRRFDR